MTSAHVAVVFVFALTAAFFSLLVALYRLRTHEPALVRINVHGRPVPAVLGDALCFGALGGLAVVVLADAREPLWIETGRLPSAVAVVVVALWAAGRWDDMQGDERPRGFAGHLGAARTGRITGGLVKLLAGGVAGLAAGALVASGRAVIEVGALVALTANLVNLLDRAPGRAGKVALLIGVPLAIAGNDAWALAVVPVVASLCVCLPFDLRARAMLGDAGANPLGGVLGLGLSVSLSEPWRLVVIALLVALNLASERFSFSAAIERVPLLRGLDLLGRGDSTQK